MNRYTITKRIVEVSWEDLFTFLRKEAALYPYLNAVAKGCKNFEGVRRVANSDPFFWIDGAFLWKNTPEGWDYWRDLAKKWRQLLFQDGPVDNYEVVGGTKMFEDAIREKMS